MVISLLGATLHGIYSAAVYEYAVGGETGAFDRDDAGRRVPAQDARGAASDADDGGGALASAPPPLRDTTSGIG